jgi:hypothetical protein
MEKASKKNLAPHCREAARCAAMINESRSQLSVIRAMLNVQDCSPPHSLMLDGYAYDTRRRCALTSGEFIAMAGGADKKKYLEAGLQ